MRERPILFSAPMVRALLLGTKTQTRRIVHPRLHIEMESEDDANIYQSNPRFGEEVMRSVACPYGVAGDRLWVREAYAVPPGSDSRDDVVYRADLSDEQLAEARAAQRTLKRSPAPWKPGIHMFRWASRITLEVTNIRAERLFDISEADAKSEGVRGPHHGRWTDREGRLTPPESEPPRCWAHSFFVAWREINGNDSLWSNPWVWVVEFRRIEAQERAA